MKAIQIQKFGGPEVFEIITVFITLQMYHYDNLAQLARFLL